MAICLMELSTFLLFVMLSPLILSVTTTKKIGMLLYSICVRILKYILYGKELHVKELNGLVPDENLAPKETLDYGLHCLKISTLPIQDSSSTTNLLKRDIPATGFTINSCSTETKDTHPYLKDAFSEDFAKLLQESETSLDSFTKENGKGFEISGTLAPLSENEPQNHSVMDTPVGTQTISLGKVSDGKTFSNTRSEEVQFNLDHLKTSVAEISTSPYNVKAGTNDDSLQNGTNHAGVEVGAFQVCDIKKKQSIEEGNSLQTVVSNDVTPVLFAEVASNKCANGNIINEMEIDGISLFKRSALGSVPIEFLYPCLPYFNP